MTAFFFTSPGFGLFCTIFIVGWLIWAGMKSAGKCLDSAGQTVQKRSRAYDMARAHRFGSTYSAIHSLHHMDC